LGPVISGENNLDILKSYRRKSFGIIIVCMMLLGAAVAVPGYYGLEHFLKMFSSEEGQGFLTQAVPDWVDFFELVFQKFYIWVIPCIMGFFFLLGIIGWLVLSVFISPALRSAHVAPEAGSVKKYGKKDFIDQKVEQERKRRLFLHTLSVLQREGRLLDFFDEDLSAYEDEQIGAAVRSIQEDCKKAVKKYIDPKSVVDGEEGDAIIIEDGFDIDAINLVGNVSGHPPFHGIIRHPGWKAGKKDVPKLSDIQDPGVMTPAEIEIQ